MRHVSVNEESIRRHLEAEIQSHRTRVAEVEGELYMAQTELGRAEKRLEYLDEMIAQLKAGEGSLNFWAEKRNRLIGHSFMNPRSFGAADQENQQ